MEKEYGENTERGAVGFPGSIPLRIQLNANPNPKRWNLKENQEVLELGLIMGICIRKGFSKFAKFEIEDSQKRGALLGLAGGKYMGWV